MSEAHWKAEETHSGWGIRYSPTPGGKRNKDGTTTYSLSFIAMQLTEMVSEQETAAKGIASELNAFPDLLAFAEATASTYDESWKEGSQERRIGDAARAAIAKTEGRA